ncbi:hypothetical protein ACNQ13_01530 [Mycoplasma sp. VS428]|uniref:hypothetical protein n=1 Tax=Mycoplasma sp. VS428 TaxID=3401684 RepID=UPI003AAEBF08
MRKIKEDSYNTNQVLAFLNNKISNLALNNMLQIFEADIKTKMKQDSSFLSLNNYYQLYASFNSKQFKTIDDLKPVETLWTQYLLYRRWRVIPLAQRKQQYANTLFNVIFNERLNTVIHRALFLALYEYTNQRIKKIRQAWNFDVTAPHLLMAFFNIDHAILITKLKNYHKQPLNKKYPSLIEQYQLIIYLVATFGELDSYSISGLFQKHLEEYNLIFKEDKTITNTLKQITLNFINNINKLNFPSSNGVKSLEWI